MKKRNLWIGILICILLFGAAVKWRKYVIVKKRNAPIVSFVKEWSQRGKPVVVQVAKKHDVPIYTKVTAWQVAPNVFEGHVSKSVRDQLQIGQEMTFRSDGYTFEGTISEVSENITLDDGLFPVLVQFSETFDMSGWVVAYAHTDTIRNVISVSGDIVERATNEDFVWKIEGGKAVKQPVKVQERNGEKLIVHSGLKEGDVVVIEGYSKLQESDKVNILETRQGGATQ